jgi:hypothetical protein
MADAVVEEKKAEEVEEVLKVDTDGASFLMLKNCMMRGENISLQQKILESNAKELKKQNLLVNHEASTLLNQLYDEAGIGEGDREDYNFNTLTGVFAKKAKEG